MMLIIITPLCISSEKLNYYYTGTVKSVLNEVGFNFDLTEDAPEGVNGYGGNTYGSTSRIVQFSGMKYTVEQNPLFGLGAGALNRDAVQYFSQNHWHVTHTYDVGYVQIFCDEGLIGFSGYILLFIALILAILKTANIKKADINQRYKLFFVATYLLCMLSTANMFSYLMVLIIICFEYKYTDF